MVGLGEQMGFCKGLVLVLCTVGGGMKVTVCLSSFPLTAGVCHSGRQMEEPLP